MPRESNFQSKLIAKIEVLFPGCVVLKNDPNYLQGIPDLIILFGNMWASLEVKREKDSDRQPNQEYYVALFNEMSYSSFVYPENEERVLYELQQTFRPKRSTRISKRIKVSLDRI